MSTATRGWEKLGAGRQTLWDEAQRRVDWEQARIADGSSWKGKCPVKRWTREQVAAENDRRKTTA